MKYLIYTRPELVNYIKTKVDTDLFHVDYPEKWLTGAEFRSLVLLYDVEITDEQFNTVASRTKEPVKAYVFGTEEQLLKTTQRLEREELKQSEEFQALKTDDLRLTQKRLFVRTLINNLSDVDHYYYLESEAKGLGDWWMLEECKGLVEMLTKIVGDFDPNAN